MGQENIKNTNYIWEKLNLEEYPNEVKLRVNCFIEYIIPYLNFIDIVEIGSGNGYIKTKLNLSLYNYQEYDLYPRNNAVKFVDMLNYQNEIESTHTVILSHVIEHFKDPLTVLKIISNKILKKNGIIILAFPTLGNGNNHQPFNEEIGHYSQISNKNIFDYAKQCNLKVKNITEENFEGDFKETWTILEKI